MRAIEISRKPFVKSSFRLLLFGNHNGKKHQKALTIKSLDKKAKAYIIDSKGVTIHTVGGLILPPKGGFAYGLLNNAFFNISCVNYFTRQKEITARLPI